MTYLDDINRSLLYPSVAFVNVFGWSLHQASVACRVMRFCKWGRTSNFTRKSCSIFWYCR